ncbi:conserved hypothetical protein [Flavobacterium sp. 9AF]|uniref:hypothetical protein n=1 Tax=Flavobacterium sp. 9AF TaxID=2653142 RepID=UPI0012EF95EB|nr:hypothetical protein [Flavobacterium sp. 9AF]VXC35887.1 conserved hypothetical protein [Flavobacterium sp. 9AF]
MIQPTEYTIKSSFYDRNRKLILSPNYIEFDDNDWVNGTNTKFEIEEIDSFRYGIKWLHGYAFTFGRIYFIEIKNKEGKIVKLKLKSVYRIRKKQLFEKYASIINQLLDLYFIPIAEKYIQLYNKNEEFYLLSIKIKQEGIELKNEKVILWNDLETRNYFTKYSLSSKKDSNCYCLFEYAENWNVAVLFSVIEEIKKKYN